MKRLFLLFAMLCLLTGSAFANTDAHVFGHIVDDETGEHIPFVTIMVKGSSVGTTTDVTGHYFLKNLKEGKTVLVVRYVGYQTEEVTVDVKKGSSQEVNFNLKPDNLMLNEVVVSANKNETNRRLAPSLVNVVDAKAFELSGSACLADGLSLQPGVRVEDNCQNCGFMQVRINGLDGHYSQILVDSRPIFSSLTGVYGLEQIPANMIERVEVVRGGGSALFGASAIGGTVNIITKTPVRNTADVSHSLMSIGGTNSFENVTMLNASLVSGNNKAGAYVFGQNRNREGYDHNGDGYTEVPLIKSQTVGLRSFLRVNDNSKFTLEYHGIHEERRGGNRLGDLPHLANITEMTEHYINGGGLSYDWYTDDLRQRLKIYSSFQKTDRDSYYGGSGDESEESLATAEKAYGTTTDLVVTAGGHYSYAFDKLLFMPADLMVGAEFNYDNLDDRSLGLKLRTHQIVQNYSGFFQNEWKNKQWSFLIGARVDKHNLVKNVIVSPRANLRYNPTENINLRLSYGSGFRAPQAFDEDLHITIASGERNVIVLADNLREERSNSFSLSADIYQNFGSVMTNFLIEGFYTELNNVFDLRKKSEQDEFSNVVWERYNASGARVYGATLEGRIAFTPDLQLQTGWTYQKSEHKEAVEWSETAASEKRMFRTPDFYGYVTLNYSPIKRLTASLNGTYTGSMLVQHVAGSGVENDIAVKTPDFFDLGLRLAYDIPLCEVMTLQVHAGVKNIFNAYQKDFDTGWNRDSGYVYGPSLPRSYFAGAKLMF